ncbi:MAG: hypothetical protein FWC06_09135 [Treponema sp.]|nr:hypothetical protein [Treponema sp.]
MNGDNEIFQLYNQLNEIGKEAIKSFINGLLNRDTFTKAGSRKIIQFPTSNLVETPIQKQQEEKSVPIRIIHAPEGTPLPEGIADLRPMLRRDGLILLSWKQLKTDPCTYDIFWARKIGMRRNYAAYSVSEDTLCSVMPNDSGALSPFLSEDYHLWGSDALEISFSVHVAPEDIVYGKATSDRKAEYIQKLEAMGIVTGPDIIFRMGDQPVKRKVV